ncbi:MAG: hypothetical protein A3F90_10890 [Deltaproteobacteria bacterium RIFCSPLOWO2_12_FULL_60_19]|nr:MAG: hypothetical protein A3F90_10890 [Deltaproteobacteria bacterium RIFCSPLOWO2_12_FULL_60_19]
MNAKLAGLARRRERLIAQSARQREELGLAYRRLLDSFGWINLAVGAIETVKAHPAAVTGLTALLVGTGWTRFQRLEKWLWLSWTVLTRVQAWRSRRRA